MLPFSPTNGDVAYSYDLHGRLLSARYPSSSDAGLALSYDALGRLTSRSVNGRQISYQYDSAGNRTRITHPDGYYVNEGRSYSGELLSLTDSTGAVLATYNYDSLGRRVSLVHGNGNTVTYGYDPATNRLSSYQDDFVGTDFDSTVNLTYNPAGQIQSRTQSNDAAYTWASSGTDKTLGLGYDRGNRLTSASSSIITLNDVRGNLQGFVSPNVMGNNNRYLYDVESRLSSVTSASNPFASLKYDPSGMLSNLTTPQSSTDYLYDGDDLIAEYQSGAVLRRYIHGDGPDEPVASYEGAGLSTRYYLHADERGSVVAVSDATGAGVATSKYSVDGASASLASEFGFTGQLWLPSVQLYYYKARMYSPQLGRFMQRDPLGYAAGLNLYAYAGGDPVNARDPSGLFSFCVPFVEAKPTSHIDNTDADVFISASRVSTCLSVSEVAASGADFVRRAIDAIGNYFGQGSGGGTKTPGTQCPSALKTAGQNQGAVNRALSSWNTISLAATANGIDPALLAAVGVRETGFQNIWQSGGGMGAGVFQIDLGINSDITPDQAFNVAFAANYAAGMLASNGARLASKFTRFTSGQLTQATAASYNFGVRNISGNPATIDRGSSGNNYGSNVVGLMSCFNR